MTVVVVQTATVAALLSAVRLQELVTRTQYDVVTVGLTVTDDPVWPASGAEVLPLAPLYHW